MSEEISGKAVCNRNPNAKAGIKAPVSGNA